MSPLTTRVRELRQAKGWSQLRLAQEAGVRQAGISRLENLTASARKLDLRILERVASALDTTVLALLEESRPLRLRSRRR
jgi:transcriptional regulator with XRE-family HTH domain